MSKITQSHSTVSTLTQSPSLTPVKQFGFRTPVRFPNTWRCVLRHSESSQSQSQEAAPAARITCPLPEGIARLRPDLYQADRGWLGLTALAEAERLVGETEPTSGEANYYQVSGLWPEGLPRPTGQGSPLAQHVLVHAAAAHGTFALIGIERIILAEALRGFVGEEE